MIYKEFLERLIKNRYLTWSNAITIIRIFLIIPFIYFLFQDGWINKTIATTIFCIASISDYVDGYLARKLKQESGFGRFFDPLADKLLIISTFICFIRLDPEIFPYWMVIIIIAREFLVTTMRVAVIADNKEITTQYLGKAKTTAQIITIICILILLTLREYYIPDANLNQSEALYIDFTRIFDEKGYFLNYNTTYFNGYYNIIDCNIRC